MRPTVPSVENPAFSACDAHSGITAGRTSRTWLGSPIPICMRSISFSWFPDVARVDGHGLDLDPDLDWAIDVGPQSAGPRRERRSDRSARLSRIHLRPSVARQLTLDACHSAVCMNAAMRPIPPITVIGIWRRVPSLGLKKARHPMWKEGVEHLPLKSPGDPRSSLDPVAEHLHRHNRVGDEIVVPVRTGGRAVIAGHDNEVLAMPYERQPVLTDPPRSGTDRGQDEEVHLRFDGPRYESSGTSSLAKSSIWRGVGEAR